MRFKTILIIIFISTTFFVNAQNEQLFEETRITFNDALDRNAPILSLSDFKKSAEHYNRAIDILKRKGNANSAKDELERSIALLTIINEDIEKSNGFFKEILTSRQNALKINSDKYSPFYWKKAEELFSEAIEEYNDNNYKKASSMFNAIINFYSRANLYTDKTLDLLFNWDPIKKADNSLASLISPTAYEKGLKYYFTAIDGLAEGEEIIEINKKISEAAKYFSSSITTANDFSQAYPRFIEARDQARNAGAELYASENWADAEELIKKAGREFEDKDNNSAKKYVENSVLKYKLSKQIAVNERLLFTSRNKIELAKNNDAENYAPVSFDNSRKFYYQAEKLIESDSYTEADVASIAEQAEFEADKANWITNIIKSVKDGKTTWEDVILKRNVFETAGKKSDQSQRTEYVKSGLSPKASKLNYDKSNLERFKEINMEILEQGDKILLRIYSINYKPTGWRLDDEAKSVLDQLKIALEDFKGTQYQISSYTDNIGAQRMNIEISELRAKTILNYLNEHSNYLSNKMTSVGYGEDNPIADNKNFEGRRKNNRIEIIISN